jgi:hypothetical protein
VWIALERVRYALAPRQHAAKLAAPPRTLQPLHMPAAWRVRQREQLVFL